MKQSVTGCYINKSGGAGVRNMMMMEDSAKLTKGILAVNYMRVAALMVYASIAQLAERRTVNAYVEGSSPSRGASRHKEDAESRRIQFNNVVIALTVVLLPLYAAVAQLAEQLICNQQVVGSSPTCGSIFRRQNDHESLQKTNDKIQKQNISLTLDL